MSELALWHAELSRTFRSPPLTYTGVKTETPKSEKPRFERKQHFGNLKYYLEVPIICLCPLQIRYSSVYLSVRATWAIKVSVRN